MASPNIDGPYPLNGNILDLLIRRTSPGNYSLGYTRDNGPFIVQYVGRSDDDIKKRLRGWVGSKYTRFKYSYAESTKDAFQKECRDYHDFGGAGKLDNEVHPGRPNGTDWRCPACTIFD